MGALAAVNRILSVLRRPFPLVLALLCPCGGLLAQQPQGVVTGFTIDERQGSVRAVLGIPGATRLGDPVELPAKVVGGAFGQGRGLAIAGSAWSVYLLQNLGAPSPRVARLETAISGVTEVFLNPSATTALLYSGEYRRLQLVTSLDSTPVLGNSIPATLLKGAFSTAAVANASSCALIASYDAEGSSIQKLCADGTISAVAQLPGTRIGSIAWFREEQDAVAVDAAGRQILWLKNLDQGAAPVTLAGPSNGLVSPSAILPLDDATIAVADGGAASLLVIDTSKGVPPQTFPLPEAPTRLIALDAPGVLACNRVGSGPLLLVDTRHNYATSFVPMN